MLISRLWFGNEVWNSYEFQRIWEGFNVNFGNGRSISSVSLCIVLLSTVYLTYIDKLMGSLSIKPEDLALTALDRRFTDISQLVDHLVFETAQVSRRENSRDKQLVAIFQKAVLLYLGGSGHPEGLRGGIVTTEDFDEAIGDPLCRARIMMKGCRETEMIPVGEWTIKVGFLSIWKKRHLNDPSTIVLG